MTFDHLMRNVRLAAKGKIGVLSTGEALAAALVLNRPDWLSDRGYTIAEALDRIDEPWIGMLREAEKTWKREAESMAQVQQIEKEAATAAALFGGPEDQESADPIDLSATLVTYSEAPGYRDVRLTFDVSLICEDRPKGMHRICLRINPQDGVLIMEQILSVHRFAWLNGKPLDKQPDEQQPRWITGKI